MRAQRFLRRLDDPREMDSHIEPVAATASACGP
jgi:hypothetical protein